MGFLETLSGRIKVLSFEIIFDDNNNVGVNVIKNVSVVSTPDYLRLWACYEAKMIYNLGYPHNQSANIAINTMSKIVESDINENTNCFQKADFDDVIRYSPNVLKGNIKFTGEFYAKGSFERNVKTWLPEGCTEQQIVFSTLALMQYVISMVINDNECIDVFTKTVRNMINLYKSGAGVGMASIVQVPTVAYMQAISLAE